MRREQTRGRTRRAWTAVAAVALSVALGTAACSEGDGIGHHYDAVRDLGVSATGDATASGPDDPIASQDFSSTPGDTGPTSTGPTASATVPPASYALVKKLIGKPASGDPWPKSQTGPMTLDRFISTFYVKDAQVRQKKLAQERGFQGAARAGWFVGDYDQEGVWLVQFDSEKDAGAMYGGLTLGWDDNSGLTTFGDAAVQGEGAVSLDPDDDGNIDVRIAFWVGATFGEIHYWAPKADKTTAMAIALKQYNLLKG